MSEEMTPRLGLPLLIGGQAQKHLTHNEALVRLDALVQACVLSRTTAALPSTPDDGAAYILPAGGWPSFAPGDLVRSESGIWSAVPVPDDGVLVFVADEGRYVVRRAGAWENFDATITALDSLERLGVGAEADAYSVLAVKGSAAWMSGVEAAYGGSGDFRLTLNKETVSDTAEIAFQSGWSGRALVGLRGNNDFTVAVSADGTSFVNGLRISPDGVADLSVALQARLNRSSKPATTSFVHRALLRRPDGVSRTYVTSNGWLSSASAADNTWTSVCWSPELGLFCAVSTTGTGNRVMTSADGVTWTSRTSAADNSWQSVCWSSELGLFCAVGNSGTGNRVMTSADGITWTIQTQASNIDFRGVCWSPELGLFCAVTMSGSGNRVLTSPDAVTWTNRASAADNDWRMVCWSPELSLFCAVAITGTGNRVMTSPDGVTWTIRASAADNSWRDVCWSPELSLFCAVSITGTGNRVMTSPDGITWTSRTSASDNNWSSVCWSPELGLFCAVSTTGTGNRVMTSADGITWTSRTSVADNNWASVCWSPGIGLFCAVGQTGTGNRVMTSVRSNGHATGRRRMMAASVTVIATDAAATITPLISSDQVRHTGTLTANRTLSLSATNVTDGFTFRISRTGGGAFALSVGGLKDLGTNSWCEVTYSTAAAAWFISQYGAL